MNCNANANFSIPNKPSYWNTSTIFFQYQYHGQGWEGWAFFNRVWFKISFLSNVVRNMKLDLVITSIEFRISGLVLDFLPDWPSKQHFSNKSFLNNVNSASHMYILYSLQNPRIWNLLRGSFYVFALGYNFKIKCLLCCYI